MIIPCHWPQSSTGSSLVPHLVQVLMLRFVHNCRFIIMLWMTPLWSQMILFVRRNGTYVRYTIIEPFFLSPWLPWSIHSMWYCICTYSTSWLCHIIKADRNQISKLSSDVCPALLFARTSSDWVDVLLFWVQ